MFTRQFSTTTSTVVSIPRHLSKLSLSLLSKTSRPLPTPSSPNFPFDIVSQLTPYPTWNASPAPPVVTAKPNTVNGNAFRKAFRHAHMPVWIVTSTDADGITPVGFTAISVVSVSVSPPILSFNINKTSSSLNAIQASMKFAVHLLSNSEDSVITAKLFACKPSTARFADSSIFTFVDGVPKLKNALVTLSGTISSFVDAGDSYVVLGHVLSVNSQQGATAALSYHNGTYCADITGANVQGATLPNIPIDSVNTPNDPGSVETSSDGYVTVPSSGKRRMFLNAFDMCCVVHQSPGLWKHPLDEAHRYNDLTYWTSLAMLLEKGGFDTLFLADVLGTYDVYKSSRDAAVTGGAQVPVNDPVVLLPAMAAVTKNLSFAVTVSLTYEKPYSFARRLSTLDHLTKGRVAWNIVTSYLKSAAVNLGLDTQIPHDQRYDIAEEFMECTYKLTEGSWEDDAVIRDKKSGTFAQPAKVHDIHHAGKYYQVPGAHLCEPSPQRTPVLFQAGTSSKGLTFAARHAEGMFVISVNPESLAPVIKKARKLIAEQGRDPRNVKFFTLVTVIVDETDELAQAKAAEYRSYTSSDTALALAGGWMGIDLSKADPDAPLKYEANDSLRSVGEMLERSDPNKVWTVRTLAEYLGIGGIGAVLIGSPKTVVDELERWQKVSDCDGFNFAYAITPGTFKDLVQYVVPELQRRGLVPHQSTVTQQTLRERLGGKDPYLSPDHPGSKYRRNKLDITP